MINVRAATCFGLIRHASTLWNEQQVIQGQHDSPLSPGGKNQAATWGKQLGRWSWQRIICSDLGRAEETAALINEALRLPVIPEPGLREQDWGRWSGMSLAAIRTGHQQDLRQQIRSGWEFRPPGGESRREVLERALAALARAQETYPGESILTVCHEGVIKCLIYHLLGRRFLPEEPRVIQNFHLHLLEVKERIPHLAQMNRLALAGAGEPRPDFSTGNQPR